MSNSFIECPYCGWENGHAFTDETLEDFPWKCEECGKNFRVDSEVQLIFYSSIEEHYRDRERIHLTKIKNSPGHSYLLEREQAKIVSETILRCIENEEIERK